MPTFAWARHLALDRSCLHREQTSRSFSCLSHESKRVPTFGIDAIGPSVYGDALDLSCNAYANTPTVNDQGLGTMPYYWRILHVLLVAFIWMSSTVFSTAQEGEPQQVIFRIQMFQLPPGLEPIRELGLEATGAEAKVNDKQTDSAQLDSKPRRLTSQQAQRLRDRLAALTAEKKIKLLAEPSLVTVIGREAWLNSGGEIPLLTRDAQGNRELTYKPFGTSVKLLPMKLSDGTLTVKFEASVSELKPGVLNNRGKLPPNQQAQMQDDPIRILLSTKREFDLKPNDCIVLILPDRETPDAAKRSRGCDLLLIQASPSDRNQPARKK